MITEAQELTIRIAALNRRVKSEKEFIQRQIAIQRSGKGVVNGVEYDSLANGASGAHKKKRKSKGGLRRNFFTWYGTSISPYEIISKTEVRIESHQDRLEELK